ncbi:MAG: hypothetical protein GY830_02700, partial [Bacteroidetes bacterium]|nr:hypothetical protein [Bacteroidota bacterium]
YDYYINRFKKDFNLGSYQNIVIDSIELLEDCLFAEEKTEEYDFQKRMQLACFIEEMADRVNDNKVSYIIYDDDKKYKDTKILKEKIVKLSKRFKAYMNKKSTKQRSSVFNNNTVISFASRMSRASIIVANSGKI